MQETRLAQSSFYVELSVKITWIKIHAVYDSQDSDEDL